MNEERPLSSLLFSWNDAHRTKPSVGVSERSTLKLTHGMPKVIRMYSRKAGGGILNFNLIEIPDPGWPWVYKDFLTGTELQIYDE